MGKKRVGHVPSVVVTMKGLAAKLVDFTLWVIETERINGPIARAIGMDALREPVLGVVNKRRDEELRHGREAHGTFACLGQLVTVGVVSEPRLAQRAVLCVDCYPVRQVSE